MRQEQRKKDNQTKLFQMASPEYQTQRLLVIMEEASFHKSRNLQCFQDPLWVFRQDSPEFLVKSLRAQFMLSIQGNVSSKQDIVFHIKEANPISEHKCYYSQLQRKMAFTFSFSMKGKEEALHSLRPERGLRNCFHSWKKYISLQPQQVSPQTSSTALTVALMGQCSVSACCFSTYVWGKNQSWTVCERLADSISDCDFPSKW